MSPMAKKNVAFLRQVFAGKPVLFQAGNHDYQCLAELLFEFGYQSASRITPSGLTIDGVKFAGFEGIPYICGEWSGELD